MVGDIEIMPCEPARDGELIRTLTRENFYAAMQAEWNEARHQREPVYPERYRMVRRGGETIGFFATHSEDDCLYLQTIQLVASARGAGTGTQLMHHIHELAQSSGVRAIRLRVFRSNEGARRLYARLGYVAISEDDHALVLERSAS